MSDNTRLNRNQTEGDVIRTVEENGVKTQVVLLAGQNDAGTITGIPVTAEGHVEAAIHGPRLPFGSVHTESLTPIFQIDGVYGANSFTTVSTTGLSVGSGSGSGGVTSSGNKLVCSTGTTQYSFATLQSRRRLRYHPGQGIVGRFAGFFTDAVANCILVAGFGTAESGVFFGYNGTSFGILHSTGGVREVHTFTVTTASTATNDYIMTTPQGNAVSVTATNNSSTTTTAYELAQGDYPGWAAQAVGSTVIFVAGSAGAVTGSFSLAQTGAATPAAGTDAETLAGSAATDTWIAQANWNGDVCDGSGSASNPSGVSLDPTNGNVYQIGIQYLGFGAITFQIEAPFTSGNQPDFITVHTIYYPGTSTNVSLSQPSFPFTMAAYSAGSTTDCSVSIGSFAGFVEGMRQSDGPRATYYDTSSVTSSTSAWVPIFTVQNSLYFQGRPNQIVSSILSLHGAAKSNTGLTAFALVRNAALTAPNFAAYSSYSSTNWDTSATACTFNQNQVEWTGYVSETGDFNYGLTDRGITIQPGERITLAVRSVTATAVCVGSINTREDQ